MATGAREQLLDFLEERAFDPVMKAAPEGRSETDKRKLADVQAAMKAEIERFRGYGEVVENFRRVLSSRPARKIHTELAALGLPIINEFKDGFEKKVSELGVG